MSRARQRKRTAEPTAERRATQARLQAERDRAAMDNPEIDDQPSDIRHAAYFVGILALGLILNLAVPIIVAGGQ